ncbi:MAG: YxeA family protein [Eubacteriales bacterium]|nr:YxeA family protein [Eubacteriales bacterium]
MSRKNVLIGISIMVLLVLGVGIAIFAGIGGSNYYTKIDNEKVSEIDPHGAMNYSYTLTAYDESGKEKELTFETGKVLSEGAYLCLEVAPIRGVVTWNEVQYDDLPEAVQVFYAE